MLARKLNPDERMPGPGESTMNGALGRFRALILGVRFSASNNLAKNGDWDLEGANLMCILMNSIRRCCIGWRRRGIEIGELKFETEEAQGDGGVAKYETCEV
jgi:hypothetical protein